MRKSTARIPLSEPILGEPEERWLRQCIEDNWVAAGGPLVATFEERFAERHGHERAVSTASGTAALHLALVELGVGPGGEVIVPTLTFVASANPIRYVGAEPVFADVDPETYTLDPSSVEALIGPKTRAIVVVHLYGQPAAMEPLLELARERGVAVIEDATEALGSCYGDELCGTLGDIGCFSFNGNKVITAGGGGMILARDPERLEHMRYLSQQAKDPGREYHHSEVGFNYALGNLQAAVGLGQLERLDELIAGRTRVAERYREALEDAPGIHFSTEPAWGRSNWWLQSVLIDADRHGRGRDEVMEALAETGIESRPFFHPIHLMPPYRAGVRPDCPVAVRLHAEGVCLPSSAHLSEDDQDHVIEQLRG